MNGILNFLKPPGMTSNNAVCDIKRLMKLKKVGHAGTLDPAAAGVLPITLGRGTRLFDVLQGGAKEYVGELTLGVTTDTLDTAGTVLTRGRVNVSKADVERAMEGFTGEIEQRPPMYSALKYGGRKLYELARKGETVEVPARKVHIESLVLLSDMGDNRYRFRVRCSKGTYVRALAGDIGENLGCGACLSLLIRTESSSFRIEDAHTFAEAEAAVLENRLDEVVIPLDYPLTGCGRVDVGEEFFARLKNGNAVPAGATVPAGEDSLLRVYCAGMLMGLGRLLPNGNIHIETMLYDGGNAN